MQRGLSKQCFQACQLYVFYSNDNECYFALPFMLAFLRQGPQGGGEVQRVKGGGGGHRVKGLGFYARVDF